MASKADSYREVIAVIQDPKRTPDQIRADVGAIFIATGDPEIYAALLDLW
jgi:hypothetical protein